MTDNIPKVGTEVTGRIFVLPSVSQYLTVITYCNTVDSTDDLITLST